MQQREYELTGGYMRLLEMWLGQRILLLNNLFPLSFFSMPAERKCSVNMDEKDVSSFSNKEKEKDRDGERRPASARDKAKEEAKMSGKKDSGKEEKRKRLEEEKKKKEEKERRKKEEEKQKADEEQKKKEEEEKRQQEEQEKKLQEEEAKRQREEEAALLKWVVVNFVVIFNCHYQLPPSFKLPTAFVLILWHESLFFCCLFF